MKKTLSIIAALLLLLTSCDNGNINGGRYYGTFHNLLNGQREAGSVSFTFVNNEGGIYFMMNDIVSMMQVVENKYTATAEGAALNDLLETLPAIDSIHVCDSLETIRLMDVEAEFMGNSVKTEMKFTTSTNREVNVQFIGYFE